MLTSMRLRPLLLTRRLTASAVAQCEVYRPDFSIQHTDVRNIVRSRYLPSIGACSERRQFYGSIASGGTMRLTL